MEHNDIIGTDGVAVHLDGVYTVFFLIRCAHGVGGELAGLACGNETGTKFKGQDRATDEAALFDAYNFGDTLVAVQLREIPANDVQGAGILERSCEVVEKNTL